MTVEDTTRRLLHELAEQAPVGPDDLFAEVKAGVRRRRRRRGALLGATAALAAASVISTVALSSSTPRTPATAIASAASAPVHSSCPAAPPNLRTFPERPGMADAMVPGTPTSALLCLYDQPWPQTGSPSLTGTNTITGRSLAKLVTDLNAAHLGEMSCPAGSDKFATLTFDYPSGPAVNVSVGLTGCRGAHNGYRGAIIIGITIPGVGVVQ